MKLNEGSDISAGVIPGYLSPSLGFHCLGTSFALFCNLQLCNEHFKTQQAPSAPPGLSTRPLALSDLCRGNSRLPPPGLSSLRQFKHVALQTQLLQQRNLISVGAWGWGADPSRKQGHKWLERCWLWGWAAGRGPGVCSAPGGTRGVGVYTRVWVYLCGWEGGEEGQKGNGIPVCWKPISHTHSDLPRSIFLKKSFSLCVYIDFRPLKEPSPCPRSNI